ncbi:MAG: protein kinase [Thermoguttaceae bacterium]|nr:protein kinase [Thermoguttaceae bacterium]MDW8036483.1 protein kinase [Thermoguttaceae bacterium]
MTLKDFERCALASGLLTEADLEEARSAGRWAGPEGQASQSPRTAEELAERLIAMGRLNRWQAKQLLEGRTRFTLGPYRIVDYLGQGGMGQVFKAEHTVLGRTVAIKVLPRSKSTPEAIANFHREIRAQAKMDHPNLVRAFDAGEDGNVHYLVVEYVPGRDLRRLVRQEGPLDMYRAASIISQVAQGLQYAHSMGMIHRDVKPGNVLVTPEGIAKLSDLGLAGPLGGDVEEDPRFGKIVGTADYISPDQIERPWEPTPAWDIYSLGCTLYYAVTGKVPFPGGTTADKIRAHLRLRPLDPRRLNPNLSAEFVDLMADMMAKDPSLRIQTAAEVVLRLAPWVQAGAGLPLATSGKARTISVSGRPKAPPGPSHSPETLLEDTQPSFPEFPSPTLEPQPSSSQASIGTLPVASAEQPTRPTWDRPDTTTLNPWTSLVLLLGIPLGLVSMVLVLALIIKMFL